MREGYREMSGLNVEMAEEGIASSAEVPEW
jgi:hypothetical protein